MVARRRRNSTSGLEGGALKAACAAVMNSPREVVAEMAGIRDVVVASHARC